MEKCIITFRSVTPAQRGEGVLKRHGIECSLRRTPRKMEEQGCGYCLQVACSWVPEAVQLLQMAQIPFRKLYLIYPGGQTEELQL